MNRMILAALAVTMLAGCASTDAGQAASREETYTPLGSFVPRKNATGKDDRTYIDKEEFKRSQESIPGMEAKP